MSKPIHVDYFHKGLRQLRLAHVRVEAAAVARGATP